MTVATWPMSLKTTGSPEATCVWCKNYSNSGRNQTEFKSLSRSPKTVSLAIVTRNSSG